MNGRTKLRTIVIGFGKIGAGYADDPLMAKYYPYASHAQVLAQHPDYAWDAVVDLSDDALAVARTKWNIPITCRSIEELPKGFAPDVAVLATPPDSRIGLLEQLPSVRAVLAEKPLGSTLDASRRFLDWCEGKGIIVQVNYWRRADEQFRRFAEGGLEEQVGRPQVIFGLYGGGLLNNGSHIVDLIRMLCGEATSARALPGFPPYPAGPIPGDKNVAFSMLLQQGGTAMVHPLRFEHYRENGIDIWGDRGRLSILVSGLGISRYPVLQNRAMQDQREVASDQPERVASTVGTALYRMYDNLAAALRSGQKLWSPGESALRTAETVQAIIDSSSGGNGTDTHA
ncbi:MAG: Gfo/Idh/MocA family oxidoreductase [Nitrospirota bacterium]